jgi:adenine-specific DNA-methyltransferase
MQINADNPRQHETAPEARILIPAKKAKPAEIMTLDYAIWQGDAETFLKSLPTQQIFDLIVTSPPYNLGKQYENRVGLDQYLQWQEGIINELVPRLKNPSG